MSQIACPSCSAKLVLPADVEGREVKCPRCGSEFTARLPPPPPPVVEVSRHADWSEGDRILAPWEPQWLYPGVVRRVQGDVAEIDFDDGDHASRYLAELRPVEVQKGDRVYARRDKGPKMYYPATVLAVRGEEVHVRFEAGGEEWTTVSYLRFARR